MRDPALDALASLSAMNGAAPGSGETAGARAQELPRDATFEQACEVAMPRVYGFIRSQVASRDVANELLGRVFLKAVRRWAGQRCSEATVHWLFRTAHTTLIDHWRVEGRRQRIFIPLEELKVARALSDDPEQAYAAKERQASVLLAVSELEERDRTLLALKFAGQRTNRQLARILEISEAVVSMRLLRALRKLRERLDRMGVE